MPVDRDLSSEEEGNPAGTTRSDNSRLACSNCRRRTVCPCVLQCIPKAIAMHLSESSRRSDTKSQLVTAPSRHELLQVLRQLSPEEIQILAAELTYAGDRPSKHPAETPAP